MDSENIKMEAIVSVAVILDQMRISEFRLYLENLHEYLSQRYTYYEIVIIDQNKKNISSSIQREFLEEISSIRWIKLAFPVEMGTALSVGLENSMGDYVVLVRANIDPVDIIGEMIQANFDGYDVVVGVAERPRTFWYKVIRLLANKLLNSIGYHIYKNSTPVRCLSRRAINTILSTGKNHHQFFIRVSNTGYPTMDYEYKLLNIDSLKKQTLFSGFSKALRLMIFNSTKPLRWISLLGVIGSLLAFIFASYSIIINIFKDNIIEGWTSMVFFSSFMFMILFIMLSFLGEYLARIINESDNKKNYYISSEENSSIMLEADRFNVKQKS